MYRSCVCPGVVCGCVILSGVNVCSVEAWKRGKAVRVCYPRWCEVFG